MKCSSGSPGGEGVATDLAILLIIVNALSSKQPMPAVTTTRLSNAQKSCHKTAAATLCRELNDQLSSTATPAAGVQQNARARTRREYACERTAETRPAHTAVHAATPDTAPRAQSLPANPTNGGKPAKLCQAVMKGVASNFPSGMPPHQSALAFDKPIANSMCSCRSNPMFSSHEMRPCSLVGCKCKTPPRRTSSNNHPSSN